MKSKLLNELPELVAHKVISLETANSIETYYNNKAINQPNRLFTVFGILGSALVGLGIILIVAHNWDNFSKPLKTLFAFLPMVIGQLVAGFSILKSKSQSWKESSATFLFFAVGACIAMVSQIYNIPADLSSYLLTWTVLGLPLIYVLNSKTMAVLTVVFASYYACVIGYNFGSGDATPWWFLFLITAVVPFYIKQLKMAPKGNVTAVLNWLLVLSLTLVLGTFINQNWPLGFLMYAMLFGVFYNLGKKRPYVNQQLRRNSFSIVGSLGIVILFIILSFNIIWNEILREQTIIFSQEWVIAMVLFVTALLMLFNAPKETSNQASNLFQYAFLVFAFIFVVGGNAQGLGAILCNVFVVVLGLSAIKIGADSYRFSILNYGLLIISTVIICRFFDTNMSFVLRGILFVLVGLGFFLTNYIMLKRQRQKDNELKK